MKGNNPLIRIMIVEDHMLVRFGLKFVIDQNPRFHLAGEVDTCENARSQVSKWKPHIILMDLRLPDGNGVELCREFLETYPTIRVLFLTSFSDEKSIMSAVMAGASGYLLKDIGPERLTQAIEMVADGHSILDYETVERVKMWAKGQGTGLIVTKNLGLSPQQLRVLELVADGKTNKEIASALNLSEKTARNYLAIIFEKLKITRRTQAASLFTKYLEK